MVEQYDVVILGGGPAGATAATLLTQAGRRVVVIEKDHFPRFHIGESLLPATVSIFERLGVHNEIREKFVHKPGGKWLYGTGEVPGDFAKSDSKASFKSHPYSYLVERSVFDKILIDRSIGEGADVRFGYEATELIQQDGNVHGVKCRDESGALHEFRCALVIDATGLRAFVPSKLRIRRLTEPFRMGIYAQYKARPTRDDAKAGWFLGQMFYDGWTWLLKLPNDRFSVGTVLTVDRFRRSGMTPTELLEHLVDENELLAEGMTDDRERISDVMVTGNMGNSSDELAGNGWVAIGDAAYFIDPCYSSGVHLAMKSAEMVTDLIASRSDWENPIPVSVFDQYQHDMRKHEKSVNRMVDAFYIASRHTSVQKLVTTMQGGYFSRKFVTFVGGDFMKNAAYISRVRFYSKVTGTLFGNDEERAPRHHPNYLMSTDQLLPIPDGNEQVRPAA